MITQDRARAIKEKCQELAVGSPWADKLTQVMSPEEDKIVRAHWMALPSDASYADAFMNFLCSTIGEQG